MTQSPGFTPSDFKRVGELADALVQLGVGELERRAVFGFPEQRGLVGVLLQMTVEAVVGDVELAADEPFRVGQIPFERLRRAARTSASSFACSPQKPSGSLLGASYILRYSSSDRTCARLLNSSGGGTGFSSRTCGSNSCIAPPGCGRGVPGRLRGGVRRPGRVFSRPLRY